MLVDAGTAGNVFGSFAPKLVELTDETLFGDIWNRPELTRRDRSLITVATLIALSRPDQLQFHLRAAMEHGLTMEELVEVVTHLAFYAGWPSAMTAAEVLQSIVDQVPPS